ncbi:adaptor protein MecA [uncultured Granulicatella sp.]|uniref:adaptor protein MecA n=1 Tax=uncultured Granulicatella sp. TaxID=316089 RepID=UPI0028DBE44A|nr:adaptor protein MecA [uncultured Granulicatella sp.]
MEMERINDDTILVRIENEDLQERGTSVPELLANPGEIEEFFHSILVEMDVIDQFEDSEGMSFQVMPNPEGIELYVTKYVEKKDIEADSERFVRNLVDTIQHSLGHRMGKPKKEKKVEVPVEKEKTLEPLDCTVFFDSFEDFVQLAKMYPYNVQKSSLYRYSNYYFLHVYQDVFGGEDFTADLALLREFGEFSRVSWEVVQEYGEVMIKDKAIETAKKYFK